MKTELRRTSLKDLDWIIPLVEAYHEFEDVQMSAAERAASVQGLVSNAKYGGLWGIYYDAEPVGYLALCTGYSIEFGGQDAIIDAFYIKPDHRRQGVGSKALALIKIEAAKMGLKALHLEIDRNNSSARKLYTGARFVERDRFLLMSCNLP